MDLKSLGEFGLIEHLTGRRKRCDEAVPVGIGDDAAVIRVPGNGSFLVCTDMLVEGIHFLRDKTPPAALGYKAMAVNFSDIAAMGGIPRQALVSVGWPADCSLAYVEEVYEGLYALADEYQVTIVGGDTVRAPFLVLNVTVLGEARERAVRRSGAKPGEKLAVTGRLGASAAGLALLLAGEEVKSRIPAEVVKDLVDAHLRPAPRVREAGLLVAAGNPSAMIDLSDGLAGDAGHLAAASGVGVLIYGDRLPVDDRTKAAAVALNKDYLEWALYGGEDYELLVTLAEERVAGVKQRLAGAGVTFSVVGEILPQKGLWLERRGKTAPLTGKGFEHF